MNIAWMARLAVAAILVSGAATGADAPARWNWDKADNPTPATSHSATPAPPDCDKPGLDGKPPADCAEPQPHDTGLEDSLSPATPIVPSGNSRAKKLH